MKIICRACDMALSRYTAVGNVPKHAHLCRSCYENLPDELRSHYVEVER